MKSISYSTMNPPGRTTIAIFGIASSFFGGAHFAIWVFHLGHEPMIAITTVPKDGEKYL
jgi:hypothetical protein